jgi:hypothetical protein
MVKPNSSRFDEVKSSNRVFLTPEEVIKNAREYAELLLHNAKTLEESLGS